MLILAGKSSHRTSGWPEVAISLILVTVIPHLKLIECKGESLKQPLVNASDPLIYKRIRYEENALQILKRYQKHLAIDEHRMRFAHNETLLADEDHPYNRTKLVEYSYYQNDHIESASITYDDLVFEAIDSSYLTKLVQYFIYNYDNSKDLAKASDKKLVSNSRCDKEMDYLMEQLAELEHSRLDGSRKAGVRLNTALNAEVLALLDSFGSEQPGLLMGNHYWTGNWRQCKKSRVLHPNHRQPDRSVEFSARYCVASLRSKRWDKLIENRLRELDAVKHFENDNQRRDYARYHRIQIGICLPESCDTRLKWRRHDDLHKLVVHKLSEPLRSYDLIDLYCLPDETSELRQLEPAGIWFLVFVGFWTCLVIIATVCDLQIRRSRAQRQQPQQVRPILAREKLIDCLSYVRNLERLFESNSCKLKPALAVEQPSGTGKQSTPTARALSTTILTLPTDHSKMEVNRLQFLNCAKVIATISIVIGHICMLLKHMDRYTLDYDCVNEWLLHFEFSAVFFVDWHFVMSGFLAVYTAFANHRVERHSAWSWFGTVVHRYLRLAPCYLLLFWFSQSIFMYTSDGPLWDYGSSNQTVRSICRRESFIYPLTLTSNLHPIYEECIMPSWYISCDFQFFLLTPFLMTLLYKSPLLGWLVTLGTIGASVAARFHRYLTDPRANLIGLMRPQYDLYQRNNWDMYPTYIYPQYRVGSYLMGVLAGHYVYMVLSGRWTSPMLALTTLPKVSSCATKHDQGNPVTTRGRSSAQIKSTSNKLYRYGIWILSLLMLTYMSIATWFLINLFPRELEVYVDYVGSVVYAISHVTAAGAFSLFLVSMALGDFSTLKYYMSMPFWSVLSRFNYLIFIGQIEVINWISGSSDSLIELNNIESFKYFMYLTGTLYILSGILTPLFETPFGLIERNFVSPLFAPPPSSNKSDGSGTPGRVPTRRPNTVVARATLGSPDKNGDKSQSYELGQVPSGESTRLVNAPR